MSNTAIQQQPTIADIILSQLGGRNRLSAMIGAYDFYSDGKNNETLVFKFKAKAKNKINYIRITLNSMDTYDIEFVRIFRKKCPDLGIMLADSQVVSKLEGYYEDMLKAGIEQETGLFLSL